jgi:hypothetical protein
MLARILDLEKSVMHVLDTCGIKSIVMSLKSLQQIHLESHNAESAMASDLRKIEGITLYTNDPERENKQYKFDLLGGRLTGRLDGVIVGLLQSPKTPHIWEHKNVNEKKFKELQKLKSIKGWDERYSAQAHLGMFAAELDRHYLTVSVPGLRDVYSVRSKIDVNYAEGLISKAERIIKAKEPPERIGGPDWFQCKYCRFYNTCHGKKK